MSDPIFSIVSTSTRPENYKQCYDSFCQKSNISFEMVFVGPNPATEFVGKNFKYIYSTVKPAQCIEIGSRESIGKYIIPTADDVKYSENFLDILYETVCKTNMNKYLLSFMGFWLQGLGDMTRNMKNYVTENYYGVSFGQCGCYSRDLWKKLGGIDKRFIHTYFDRDLHFRCYEIGMEFKLVKNIYIREFFPKFPTKHKIRKWEKRKFEANRLCSRYGDYSESLMKSLWLNSDGSVSKKRLLPVEPFEDIDIKEQTQGEKGEWK